MLRDPTTANQRRLAIFFKQFVNKTLLRHFKSSQQTLNQWNYFSSLISHQHIDYQKLQVYVQVLSSPSSHYNSHSHSPSKNQYNLLKAPVEQKKTNSGIFKKDQLSVENQRFDMQLNKTVGGNADRIKFTGMLQSKSNAYTLESKEKKVFMKKQGGGVQGLIQSIGGLSQVMGENHTKMEKGNNGVGGAGNGVGMVVGSGMGNGVGTGIGTTTNGGSFYKW